jgi:hypothetical protein
MHTQQIFGGRGRLALLNAENLRASKITNEKGIRPFETPI